MKHNQKIMGEIELETVSVDNFSRIITPKWKKKNEQKLVRKRDFCKKFKVLKTACLYAGEIDSVDLGDENNC